MRTTVIILIISIITLFNSIGNTTVSGLWAQESESKPLGLSLKDARDYALKHNAVTKNARLDIAMAKKKIWETTTDGLPKISGKVSYLNNLKIQTTLIPAQFVDPTAPEGTFIGMKFGTQHNATLELKVDQLIFSGSYIVALQASKVYLRLSQESLRKTEIEVKQTVSETYYLVLLAESLKKTLQTNLENVKKILYQTEELHKAGFIEDTDADQLQLTVTEMENSVKSMDRQVNVTYNLLKFQMGLDLHKPVVLSQTLEDILKEINNHELLNEQFQLKSHIDFRMAETQVKSMKLLWKRELSTYLPTVSAFFSHSRMAMRDKFNFFNGSEQWFPSTALGLSIEIPIFQTGMKAARVAQAKMDLRKAENTRKQVSDSLKLGLIQARSTFSDAFDTSNSTKKNVVLAKKIYDKTTTKFTQGTASSLDLTQAHNQYLKAESSYTQAIVELLKAKTSLDKALNRL